MVTVVVIGLVMIGLGVMASVGEAGGGSKIVPVITLAPKCEGYNTIGLLSCCDITCESES